MVDRITMAVCIPLVALVESMTDSVISPFELVVYSAGISLIGGVVAATRQKSDPWVPVNSGLNTMVMGASIAMIGYPLIHNYPEYLLAAVGVTGLLSLGGLKTVDWALGLLKQRIKKKAEEDDE